MTQHSLEENKVLARRHEEDVVSRCDLAAIEEIYTDDVIFRGPEGMLRGKAAVSEWITGVHRAFREFSVTLDFMIAEGDRVVVRDTTRGYHRHAFMDMAASDRRLVLPKILVFRIEAGKIAEVETFYNSLLFVDELGTPVPLLKKL